MIGIESAFEYGEGDFIHALTTPYGTTLFGRMESFTDYWVQATDPLGATERLYYAHLPAAIPATESQVPTGFTNNASLNTDASFFWSKRAWMLYPGDFTKAWTVKWRKDDTTGKFADVIASEKMPLEGRVWYEHTGTATANSVGTYARPAKVGRILDDGSSQIYKYEYNTLGKVTRETDPVGRTKTYTYDTNGIDLLQVRQVNGQDTELLASYTYDSQHQPLTVTDASGQTTTYTYLADGRPQTVVTPPRNGPNGQPLSVAERTTTYSYYADNAPTGAGRLQTITGPTTAQGSPTTTYSYDGYGRMATVTDPDGYSLSYEYDALDRRTKVSYPDGTYEQTTYNRLDEEGRRDRLGRWSHAFHDALRRVVATRDALGRTTQYQYGGSGCPSCGGGGSELSAIIDPNGNATRWDYDVQGRVTTETRADSAQWIYGYEATTGRLKTVTDPNGNVKTHTYNLDNKIQSLTYTVAGGTAATAGVSYTYDPVYGRVVTMTDGTGVTTYGYNPITSPPTLGAGMLASVDGPLADDTVFYSYDELRRAATHGLSAFSSTASYDALGRMAALVSPVGSFAYSYDGVTTRPQSLSYPNGQSTNYTYFPNAGDHRLQQLKHLTPGAATISQYDYTHDAVGNITTWSQQVGANPAKLYTLGYDAADQLTSAVVSGPNPLPTPSRFAYAYDSAGNRTAQQLDDAVMGASHNNRNQLVSRQPSGALLFKGSVNEAATMTVGGKPAQVGADNSFAGQATVSSGTSNVVVAATDASGNTRTNTYQVSQSGATGSYTYDANGSLTGDGTKTYQWDAENRLVAIIQGGTTLAAFSYDGKGRRAQKTAGGVTHSYVYDAADVIEERLGSGSTYRYVRGPGVDEHWAMRDGSGTVSYYLADHLGSVVQTTNAAGAVTLAREYDPYGNLLSGASTAGYAFTGREWDAETGLYYYRARYYDPSLARFVSEDRVRDGQGSRYGYVRNRSTTLGDPSGMAAEARCCTADKAAKDVCEKAGEVPDVGLRNCLQKWCPFTIKCASNQECEQAAQANNTTGPIHGFSHEGTGVINVCLVTDDCDAKRTIYHEALHICGSHSESGNDNRAMNAAEHVFKCKKPPFGG